MSSGWSYWSLLFKLRAVRSVCKCPGACWEGTCHGSPESGQRTQGWAELVADQESTTMPRLRCMLLELPEEPQHPSLAVLLQAHLLQQLPVVMSGFWGWHLGQVGGGSWSIFPCPCTHLLQARPQTAPGNSFSSYSVRTKNHDIKQSLSKYFMYTYHVQIILIKIFRNQEVRGTPQMVPALKECNLPQLLIW